nr:MAG TPA: hypothetical protein [Caudoviricetes sp.]
MFCRFQIELSKKFENYLKGDTLIEMEVEA